MSDIVCACECTNKGPHAYHRQNCPMRDHVDSLKAQLKNCYEQSLRNDKILWRNIKISQVWEGKFHAVKRENNTLRKKLFKGKA